MLKQTVGKNYEIKKSSLLLVYSMCGHLGSKSVYNMQMR